MLVLMDPRLGVVNQMIKATRMSIYRSTLERYRAAFTNTVNSPLTDSLVSGQLYLWTLFSTPLFTFFPFFSYGNNSRKWTALLTGTFANSRGCPLTRELTVLLKLWCYVTFVVSRIRKKYFFFKKTFSLVSYGHLSDNGHSRKRTVLLTDTVFNSPVYLFPLFSYKNNSRKRTALLTDTSQFPIVSAYERVDCTCFFSVHNW